MLRLTESCQGFCVLHLIRADVNHPWGVCPTSTASELQLWRVWASAPGHRTSHLRHQEKRGGLWRGERWTLV